MHKKRANETDNQKTVEVLIVIALLALVLAVRLYYFTGPIFANTQDEGIYLNLLSQAVVRNNPVSFSQYRNVNFSNSSQGLLNPADIPSFYAGLLYPEIFLLSTFGFSSSLAIYYIIFNSLIEALFIFLILKEISTTRAAIIGTVLFAFFPLDVIFSNHIQPLVPAMALVTAATYMFIKSENDKKSSSRTKLAYYSVTGFLVGLGYLTNPLALLLGIFIILFEIFKLLKDTGNFKSIAVKLAFVLIGFMIAFSITGVYYYTQSGNFLLYPMVDHASAVNNVLNQPKGTVLSYGDINFTRTDVQPFFYAPLIFDLSSFDQYHSSYFSLIGYLGMIFAVVIVLCKVRYGRFFACMLVLYYALLNLYPLAFVHAAGKLQVFLIYMEPMLTTPLTLPFIVIVALGLEFFFAKRRRVLTAIALLLIISTIILAVKDLNSDIGYYRNSVASIYSLEGFIASHSQNSFYAYPAIADEINDISGYRYNVRYLLQCNKNSINQLSANNGTYLLTGGSISMDIDPQVIRSFSSCVQQNATANFTLVYTSNNPFDTISPVKIYESKPT